MIRRLNLHPLRGVLACVALVALLSIGGALAQPAPGLGGATPVPTTLRLAQAVARLPSLHLYPLAQDERGLPVPMQAGELSILVGSSQLRVEPSQGPEGIGIIFLIDVSASLNQPQFEMIRASVRTWIERLTPADRAAIVTFGSSVTTAQDFTAEKAALGNALARLMPRDQRTLLYQGLIQALDMSRRLDGTLPLRRAIVVLTDGLDDQQGGAGRQEVIDKLDIDPTPIYGLGASAVKRPTVDEALKQFSALVRQSGGDYRRIDLATLDRDFSELHRLVQRTQHFTASCQACTADGSTLNLLLSLERGPARLGSNSVRIRAVGDEGKVVPARVAPAVVVPPPAPPSAPEPKVVEQKPVEQKPAEVRPAQPEQPKETRQPAHPGWSFNIKIGSILQLSWQWWLLLPLLLAALAAALWSLLKPPAPPPPETRIVGPTMPRSTNESTGPFIVAAELRVPTGTHLNEQRLRLYPLGHNELPPTDILFEGELAIGRSTDNQIIIDNDTQVSGHHCTLAPDRGLILVRDENSRNGTRVNRVPIKGAMHAQADSILGVGRTELRMQLLPAGAA